MSTTVTRMELLKMARELVMNEYLDKRAQDHNKWLAEADSAWKSQGTKLPYPTFPVYPSEADIIARAQALDEFLNKGATDDKKETEEPVGSKETSPDIVPISQTAVEENVDTVVDASIKAERDLLEKLEKLKLKWEAK